MRCVFGRFAASDSIRRLDENEAYEGGADCNLYLDVAVFGHADGVTPDRTGRECNHPARGSCCAAKLKGGRDEFGTVEER